MILPFGVPLHLRAVKVDFPQVAGAVSLGLIVEVTGTGMAALATGCHRLGPHLFTEFHDGNKAVAACTIPFLCPWVGSRSKGGERTPNRRRKADRKTRLSIVERL